MPVNDLNHEELIKTLTENFSILADEVQLLSDRKTILEHKLKYAHESVSIAIFITHRCLLLYHFSRLFYDEKL